MKNFFSYFWPISFFTCFFGLLIWTCIHKNNEGHATLGQQVVVNGDTLVVIDYESDLICILSNGKRMDYDLFESVKLKK